MSDKVINAATELKKDIMGEQKEVSHAARVEIGVGVSGKASWRRLLLI